MHLSYNYFDETAPFIIQSTIGTKPVDLAGNGTIPYIKFTRISSSSSQFDCSTVSGVATGAGTPRIKWKMGKKKRERMKEIERTWMLKGNLEIIGFVNLHFINRARGVPGAVGAPSKP